VISRAPSSLNFPPLKREGRIGLSETRADSGRDHFVRPMLERSACTITGLRASLRVLDELPRALPRDLASRHGSQIGLRVFLSSREAGFAPRHEHDWVRLHADRRPARRRVSRPDNRNRGCMVRPDASAETCGLRLSLRADGTIVCIPTSSVAAARTELERSFRWSGQNETPSEPHSSRQPNKNFPPLKREGRIGGSETKADPGRDHRTIDTRMTPTRAAARLDLPLSGGGMCGLSSAAHAPYGRPHPRFRDAMRGTHP
jgi:hypothetical protein